MYICPKCASKLYLFDKQYRCQNGHCYDISSSGYVNLILGSKKNGNHGDNKEMITARRAFLSLGYYSPIISELSDIIVKSGKKAVKILDAGCGEGYYTSGLLTELSEIGISANVYAVDVSKDAVAPAAKKYKNISFAVASINALPFKSEAFDYVLSLFAPLNESEFSRVLKHGGALITVSPSENHLFGLKAQIYDTPYKNPPSTFENKLLTKSNEYSKEWQVTIDTQLDIQNLFKMTPYYYNTGTKGIERACSLNSLTTDIGFTFGVYEKDVSVGKQLYL